MMKKQLFKWELFNEMQPIEDLEKKQKEKVKPTKMVTRQNRQTIKTELDLRGYRYEDALIELDQYLDQAVLSNYEQVYIIHGKGTGALQKGDTKSIPKSIKVLVTLEVVCQAKVDLALPLQH